MRSYGVVLVLVCACVQTASVTCPDGTVCRVGTECVPVPTGYACAGPEVVCGNGRVEAQEVCDDGNTRIGDGCSPDCLSDETCGNNTVDPVVLEGTDLVGNERCDDGDHAGHDGCSSGCEPETPRVIEIGRLPKKRIDTAMANDVARRRIIMFGGLVGEEVNQRAANDTWELDSEGWVELRIPRAPTPRFGHAMAATDEGIVLFGGAGGVALADTWMLVGNAWELLSPPSAPPARVHHAMASLPGVGVVLFGGDDGKGGMVFGDTWIFANRTWTQFSGASPPARTAHTLTFDPVHQVLVLTTGQSIGFDDRLVDTWTFDGTEWRMVAGGESPNVVGAAASFDRRRGELLLHGGLTASMLVPPMTSSTTYAWNGSSWTIIASPAPDLMNHVAATDPASGEAVMFGGTRLRDQCLSCPVVFANTYRFEEGGWKFRPFAELRPSVGAAATTDVYRRRAVLFTPDRSTYEMGQGSWVEVNTGGPAGRAGAAMAVGPVGTDFETLLVGGSDSGGLRTDVMWTWNGSRWLQRTPGSLPSPRDGAAMVFDAARRRTVMVGGRTSADGVGETWSWDGATWSMIPSSIPPRVRHAMAYDPIHEAVLVFGGVDPNDPSPKGDFWRLDDTGWTLINTSFAPQPRSGAGMAWDAARQRVVLFGGSPNSDVWEWDGFAWSFANAEAMPVRTDFALVSAPNGAGVIAVAGAIDAAIANDQTSWFVHTTGSVDYAACRSFIDDDDDGLVGCEDPDCWATCTPLCPPGKSCAQTAPRCGDGVCDSPRERCGSCADCPCP